MNRLAFCIMAAFLAAPAAAQQGPETDIRNAILAERSGDCGDYVGTYVANVEDIQKGVTYRAEVRIDADDQTCTLSSNGTPNHDFNGATARFANDFRPLQGQFRFARNPEKSGQPTQLAQVSYDAILLNGAPVDLLSAGCYRPDNRRADENGNVLAGCRVGDPWLIDPPAYDDYFGVDLHNAHTQPDGRYHYHANPNALFEDRQFTAPSPVIGFASDGFPVFGTIFRDASGEIRAAISGYELKTEARPSPPEGPGGMPDGTYIADYEFTGTGDLDECNGMTVEGQYGYYVTTTYPWILNCFAGTPDPSFRK
ncbi:MAG: YHYH protein [Pseudomonadota bacterium]